MTHHAAAERRELAETLRRAGPAAPTLCEGWTAADLAAHLVLRGRSPRYALALARDPAAATRQGRELADRLGYPALIERIERIGPLSPARIGAADDAVNLIEYVVHHEDVRRAGGDWVPRALPADRQAALWRALRVGARTLFRRSLAGLSMQWAPGPGDAPGPGGLGGAGGPALRGAHPQLWVRGAPVELVLVAWGRTGVAQVELDGPTEQVARFRERAARAGHTAD
ncbi:MAG: TIGR03085 family protein [Frankiaceae bacterium]|nr:TIGR03085 family protein [Frankiaceae bacterium]